MEEEVIETNDEPEYNGPSVMERLVADIDYIMMMEDL